MNAWIPPALLAFFLWGLWAFLPKITLTYYLPLNALVWEVLGGMLVGLYVFIIYGKGFIFHPTGTMLAMTSGMVGFAGALAYLTALQRGPVSLISVVTGLYPLVTILLAYFILGEMMTFRQLWGVGFAVVGLLLLTL